MTFVDDELVAAARAVRAHAWAPFSGFAVGAAVRHRDGRIVTGCNVENATYGLTICAERVAIVKAISEGMRPDGFTAIAVVADTDEPTPPCGACRQILWEFCGDVPVILATPARSRPCSAWRPCSRGPSTRGFSGSDRCEAGAARRAALRGARARPAVEAVAAGGYHGRMLPTIAWQDDAVVMVDQRKLPTREVYLTCRTPGDVARAIKTMVIRGAPAIGVSAAYGLALSVRRSKAAGTKQLTTEFLKDCELLAATRPTAVNLFWAIDRMKRVFSEKVLGGASVDDLRQLMLEEAQAIHDEDVASCREIGRFGGALVPQEAGILTHCNAGALATAGYGTALGVIRGAIEQGRSVTVFADETRPVLQGARLTAWELVRDGIDTTVISDNMAAVLMRQGRINFIVVGADRIAANGDAANKIGTYTVAVLAKEHGVPFYVAAPLSTIDMGTADGDGIPIEERSRRGGHPRRLDADRPR